MFKFSKQKSAEAQMAAQAVNATPLVPKPSQEALAIGGGNAKALAEAVEAARGKLQGVDAEQLRTAATQTPDGVRAPAPGETASSAPDHKARSMTDPNAESGAPKSANGNGADAKAGDGPTSHSLFTEPTPGGKLKTVAQLFGEIVWLFSQSPKHKNFFVSDLEWLVMTPILLKQFRVFYAPDRPIGVALWAYVTDEVEQRLMTGHARLAPTDWKGGEKLWLVDIVAPFGGHDAMIADLKEKVFAGRECFYLRAQDGKVGMTNL
jgi:cytolysin-activating lysine-acyltransferase